MEQKVRDVLHRLGQFQLLSGIEGLSLVELQFFLQQIQNYSLDLAAKQKDLIARQEKHIFPADVPCCNFERSGNPQDRLKGEELLRQGKVGCLILAGGQGTRLGYE